MIKKAKKSVAIGLSVALAVTSVNIPVDSASAAAKKAKLSATKKTLTAGKSTTLTLKTNKKKAKTIKTIKAKYVKVSTSKKSVATVKKVSKKSKVTGIKVTAKKAGKATITVKVTKGTYKGTYKCTVTVKKKASATKKPTQKPTEVPTATPEVTVEPTVEPTTTPAITAEPATTPAITAEPATTPAITATPVVKSTVVKASNITKEGKTFQVLLSFEKDATEASLKNTTLTLTGPKTVKASFVKLDATGKAVYEIKDEADIKALTPGDTTANGTYKVTSPSEELVIGTVTAEYEEALAGNAVAGYVKAVKKVDKNGKATEYEPVANAIVKIDGGQSVKTDADGYYKVASVNGNKKVSVSANDYLEIVGKRVNVNRNHVTSQNFVLNKFEENKVYANVTVKDDTQAKEVVAGATVTISKADGTKVAEAVTDASGIVYFANADSVDADSKTTETTAKARADKSQGQVFFTKGQTYTVTLEKKMTVGSYTSVFLKQNLGTITIGNKYNHNVDFTAKRVQKTPSVALTQNFTTQAAADAVGKTDASTTINMKAKYTVYTTVYGKMDKILEETVVADAGKVANKSVTTDIIAKAMNNATLPTGNYFVVIEPEKQNTADTTTRVAKAAVKVVVTEGKAAKASVNITEGYLREFKTNVMLTPEEEKALGDSTSFDETTALKTVVNSAGAYTPTTAITVNYNVYQIIDGDKVPVGTTSNAPVHFTKEKTYEASSSYAELLGYGNYAIESAGDYVLSVDKTESINNKVNSSLTYNTDAAWNVVKATFTIGDASVLKDSQKLDDMKLKKVVAKNVATGKLTTVFDYEGNNANLIAPTESGAANKGDTLSYTIAKRPNLAAGKYTLTYSFVDYADVTTAEFSVIGLEEYTSNVANATFVKSTSDATTIAGTITTKADNGTTDILDGTKKDANSLNRKPIVVLLDSKGKVAGVATIDANGTYELVDQKAINGVNSIAAGSYKLVVRADGYETVIRDITVTANKTITENVELVQGGKGEIKAVVTDKANFALNQYGVPAAYDSAYVNMSDKDSYVSGKSWIDSSNLFTDYMFGAYIGKKEGKTITYSNLSAGTYKVMTSVWNVGAGDWLDSNEYETKAETVIIKENGDKVYPEWTYAKKDDNDKVNLTVNFDASVQSAVKNQMYVITVTDETGKVEKSVTTFGSDDIVIGTESDGSDKLSKNYTKQSTLSVTSGKAYTVSLYTESGYLVSSNNVNVQKVDTSVSLTVGVSNQD